MAAVHDLLGGRAVPRVHGVVSVLGERAECRLADGHDEPSGLDARFGLADTIDGGQIERRHEHPLDVVPAPHQIDHRVGDCGVGVVADLVGLVLDLDVDAHPVASVERGGEKGTWAGSESAATAATARPSGKRAS